MIRLIVQSLEALSILSRCTVGNLIIPNMINIYFELGRTIALMDNSI